jgi:hypothetical protein
VDPDAGSWWLCDHVPVLLEKLYVTKVRRVPRSAKAEVKRPSSGVIVNFHMVDELVQGAGGGHIAMLKDGTD